MKLANLACLLPSVAFALDAAGSPSARSVEGRDASASLQVGFAEKASRSTPNWASQVFDSLRKRTASLTGRSAEPSPQGGSRLFTRPTSPVPLRGKAFDTSSKRCPAVWTQVAASLTPDFFQGLQCTDKARGAIRLAFHDCFPDGKCDGSVILANEYTNSENSGLVPTVEYLGPKAAQFGVGTADLIQFAAALGTLLCPFGPVVPVYAGRTDGSVAAPLGVLPSHNASSAQIERDFGARGFSSRDIAALIGSHTAAKQRFVDPSKAGAALDSTPGIWDVKYYQETLDRSAPFTFESDINIANSPNTGPDFKSFVNAPVAWSVAFVSAWDKMTVLGVPGGANSLTTCTSNMLMGAVQGGVTGLKLPFPFPFKT